MPESLVIPLALSTDMLDALAESLATKLLEQVGERRDSSWLDVMAAAEYLACTDRRGEVSPKRIYDLVRQGRLRHAKDGRRLLFRREWLDDVLELGPA